MSIAYAMRQLYNQLAEHYDQFADIPRDIADRLLERLDWIKLSPEKVLDVGAGTGYCAQQLSVRYPEADIIAVDVSENMLAQIDGIQTVRTDAMDLPFKDQSVDLILANLCLDTYIDMPAFFSEMQRVLVKGGYFLFTTLGEGSFPELKQSAELVDQASHVNPFYPIQQVAQALQKAGFVDPVVDHDNMIILYDDWPQLIQELKALGSVHWLSTSRQGLMTPRQLAKWQMAYQEQAIDGLLPVSLDVIFGHGCGRGHVAKVHEVSVPLENIRSV